MKRATVIVLVLAACSGSADITTSEPATTGAVTTTPQTTGSEATEPATTTPVTTTPATTTQVGATDCPEVLAAEFHQTAVGVFTVSTTVRSVDIEGVSFADAWEVRDLAGNVLGIRVLAHPHANEQPFTRSLNNVEIPVDTTSVVIDARDSVRGFCGSALTVDVPHS